MLIEYLKDHEDFIPTLAQWHYRQWSYLHENDSIERRIKRLRQRLGGGRIPTTFVAVEGDILLGSASLIVSDMDIRPELTPWLASVFVAPEHRNQGVASALVKRVIEQARALKVKTFYLFTTDKESLYARLGWKVRERTRYRGEQVVIMEFRFKG